MANGEVFVQAEGVLSMVQASASGGLASGARVWATGSAPPSAIAIAYVDAFSFTSAQQLTTIRNRALPTHTKQTMLDPIQVTFTCKFTGAFTAFLSASGATLPMGHLEYKAIEPLAGATSGRYFQFHGVAFQQVQFSEAADGDTLQMTCVALGMNGPTASGYLY